MIIRLLSALLIPIFFAGCGVRGRPQPPLQPPELGRGQPTFKRASEEFAFAEVPSPETTASPSPAPAEN